jgi:hypothetical protein
MISERSNVKCVHSCWMKSILFHICHMVRFSVNVTFAEFIGVGQCPVLNKSLIIQIIHHNSLPPLFTLAMPSLFRVLRLSTFTYDVKQSN